MPRFQQMSERIEVDLRTTRKLVPIYDEVALPKAVCKPRDLLSVRLVFAQLTKLLGYLR